MKQSIIQDVGWWPHRFDAAQNAVHYIKASRQDHRDAVFLTDEYLKNTDKPTAVPVATAVAQGETAPLHFIFHSAYSCSTLLARAFDMPGISMGLKEPVILNDIVGWHLRGAKSEQVMRGMGDVLTVLSRPFGESESVIAKPSNVVNGLAPLMMHIRPQAQAVFLYAPLRDFLGSIARKEMWGRLWVRDLMIKQLQQGIVNLGFQGNDYLGLTDIQVAAVGWLAQHALFANLVQKYGPSRIKTLDSTVLMAAPDDALTALGQHFGLAIPKETVSDIVAGPIFQRHSKFDTAFDADAREAERKAGEKLHADEIEKVTVWAESVAQNAGVSLTLPASLLP